WASVSISEASPLIQFGAGTTVTVVERANRRAMARFARGTTRKVAQRANHERVGFFARGATGKVVHAPIWIQGDMCAGNRSGRASSGDQDDLAELAAGGESLVGGRRIGHRERLGHG